MKNQDRESFLAHLRILAQPKSYVYIAQTSDLVKIGVAKNPADRMRTLRSHFGCKFRLLVAIPGSRREEQEMQREQAAFHIGREFFKMPADRLKTLVGIMSMNKLAITAA